MTAAPSHDRKALVTGASRGLGLVLARLLAQRGYALIINARGEEALHRVGEELSKSTKVTTVAGDVSEPTVRERLRLAAGDRLDLLINNASLLGTTPLPPLLEYDLATLRSLFEVNAIAPLALVQELAPALASGRGRVVNISSDAARGGYPGWGGYGMSKAALELMSATLAHETDSFSVMCVDPGDMRTEMHQAAYPGEDISDRPTPDETLPFWLWLLERRPEEVDGGRFEAQAEVWEVAG